tara:strand:- start:3892 stop:4359 length:468 start_codon:yes stop_codon:yes gene_type:complete
MMSREIKFRAWLPSCKTMLENVTVYPDMIGLGLQEFEKNLGSYENGFEYDGECVRTTDDKYENVLSVLSGEDWVYVEPKDYILEQFTGRQDKNGKDIYEGDIVFKDEEKCVIRFNLKEGVVAAYPISGNANFICSWGWNEMEVIGNIHQNKELLK